MVMPPKSCELEVPAADGEWKVLAEIMAAATKAQRRRKSGREP